MEAVQAALASSMCASQLNVGVLRTVEGGGLSCD
jgi:hypothetical protein